MAQQIITYVGKETKYVGKTLWEIVGNLKDYGVGRIVVRNRHLAKYKTPCYYEILSVKTLQDKPPPWRQIFRPSNDHRDKDVS